MSAPGKVKEQATSGLLSQLPVDRLTSEVEGLGKALGTKGLSKVSGGIDSLTGRLNDYASGKTGALSGAVSGAASGGVKGAVAEGLKSKVKDRVKSGASGVTSKVKETVRSAVPGGGGGKIKVTNIVESIDVPVSREVAYRQWTEFQSFPSFMKKVENVDQEEDQVLTWKAQIFLSHRNWKATVVDQVPNEHIVWKSEGDKGHVDGAVTFHELAPDLTRILVTLEYHPQGLFEHTGNLWRAQGRRVRVELKHFRRHVATNTLLHPDDVTGWTGEIHDSEVTSPPEDDQDSAAEDDQDSAAEDDQDSTAEDDQDDQDSTAGDDDGSTEESEEPPKKRSAQSTAKKSAKRSES